MVFPDFGDSSTALYYWCSGCRTELTFSQVEYMTEIKDNAFNVKHTCWCQPDHVFERRFSVNHGAIKRLLGTLRPSLPYQAAPGEALPLHRDKERLIRLFAFDCEQLASVEEFLLFCGRPPER